MKEGWSAGAWLRVMAAVVVAAGMALAGSLRAAEPEGTANTVPFEIIVEGPPGPYPYGHSEFRVTVYEGALADAPPETTNLAVQSELLPVMALPQTVKIEIPAARLANSVRPQVSVGIAIARRVAFVSDTAVPLERSGPTRVAVKAVP